MMEHKVLLGGTSYNITGGRTILQGTSMDIQGGRTVLQGTGMDIKFSSEKTASDYDIGDIIYIQEGTEYAEYIVVHQGVPASEQYEQGEAGSCNGTWIMRKDALPNKMALGGNTYSGSNLWAYLMGDFWALLGGKEITALKRAYIPFYDLPNSELKWMPSDIFALSVMEAGSSPTQFNAPKEGSLLDYFEGLSDISTSDPRRQAKLNGEYVDWSLRSVFLNGNNVWFVRSYGNIYGYPLAEQFYPRPAMILKPDTAFDASTNRIL